MCLAERERKRNRCIRFEEVYCCFVCSSKLLFMLLVLVSLALIGCERNNKRAQFFLKSTCSCVSSTDEIDFFVIKKRPTRRSNHYLVYLVILSIFIILSHRNQAFFSVNPLDINILRSVSCLIIRELRRITVMHLYYGKLQPELGFLS